MNIICRHCLKTNRIRKELLGKWTRCQFCNAEMEDNPQPASKARRTQTGAADVPTPEPVAMAAAGTQASGGGFGVLVLIALAVGVFFYFRDSNEQQRIARERRAADDRQMMELLVGGASAAADALLSRSRPAQAPQDIGPSNPALKVSPPLQYEYSTVYDANGNRVGSTKTLKNP